MTTDEEKARKKVRSAEYYKRNREIIKIAASLGISMTEARAQCGVPKLTKRYRTPKPQPTRHDEARF